MGTLKNQKMLLKLQSSETQDLIKFYQRLRRIIELRFLIGGRPQRFPVSRNERRDALDVSFRILRSCLAGVSTGIGLLSGHLNSFFSKPIQGYINKSKFAIRAASTCSRAGVDHLTW